MEAMVLFCLTSERTFALTSQNNQNKFWVIFFIKSNKSFLLSSSPNCGWTHGFILSALEESENQRSPRYSSLKLGFVCIIYI